MSEAITVVSQPSSFATVVQPPASVLSAVAVGQGPAGPAGPAGSDLNYRHQQSTPSNVWVIVHSLGKYPSVTVIDSAGSEVEGEIVYDNDNQVTIVFSAGFSGNAYLN